MKMTIVVTQEMIDRAEGMREEFQRTRFCPVALGVKKAFNSPCGFSGYRNGGVERKKNPIEFYLPKEAQMSVTGEYARAK